VNTVAPALSGTFAEGQTVTCSTGTWTGNPVPTYTYQWYVNGVAESGATSPSLVIPATAKGKTLYCRVTATNTAGSASANSNTVTVVYPYAPAVLALTPLVYYRLGDTAAPFDDESASNSNATLIGTGIAYQQTGLLTNDANKAVVLSGSTTAINSPNLVAMNNNNPFTIVVPFLTTSLAADRGLWHKGNNTPAGSQGHHLMIKTTGALEFNWNRSGFWRWVTSAAGLVVANTKAHWAFAYDGDLNFKIYKDGVLVENLTMFNQPTANTLALYIGGLWNTAGPSNTFNGTLDEFAYFSRVLATEEIAGLYSAYSTGTPS
jgi:Concanavalin A-like lectin/glucanases superfamily